MPVQRCPSPHLQCAWIASSRATMLPSWPSARPEPSDALSPQLPVSTIGAHLFPSDGTSIAAPALSQSQHFVLRTRSCRAGVPFSPAERESPNPPQRANRHGKDVYDDGGQLPRQPRAAEHEPRRAPRPRRSALRHLRSQPPPSPPLWMISPHSHNPTTTPSPRPVSGVHHRRLGCPHCR